METVLTCLETLIRDTKKSEKEVMAAVFETGVRQLCRERVLGQYLNGKITRDNAIESAGIDWVELAERQHTAVMEDITWALEK